jgi:hypothetical protein
MHKMMGVSILSLGLCVGIAGSAGAMSLAGGSAQSVDRSGIASCKSSIAARRLQILAAVIPANCR